MHNIELNIYKKENGKKVLDKKFETNDVNIKFGVLEDLMEVLEAITNKSNEKEILEAIFKNLKNIKPLLLDIFDGLTDEDLRKADTNEIVKVVSEIISWAINQINGIYKVKN